MRKIFRKLGFTLVEILVIAAIISLLSSVIFASLNGPRLKARDASRKASLRQVFSSLEVYYTKYGAYPSTGATGPTNGGTTSTQGTWLQALVTDGFFPKAPVDPVNVDQGPWCWGGNSAKNTIFTYASDGQHFILCGWMENTGDSSTLQYQDVPNPWNTAQTLRANFAYSNYNTVIAR